MTRRFPLALIGALLAAPAALGQLGPADIQKSGGGDCCTAEATARIAGKAGFLEVDGIKLGMSMSQALAAVHAHNGQLKDMPVEMDGYEALPDIKLLPVIYSATKPPTGEVIELEFTMPPSQPFLWGISRQVSFKPEDAPTRDNMLAALRQKYGPETKIENDILTWIFDAQGKALPPGTQFYTGCEWNFHAQMIDAMMPQLEGRTLHNGRYSDQMEKGYFYTSYGRDPSNGFCGTHSQVIAQLSMHTGEGQARNLVGKLVIGVANHQLEYSGVQASYLMLKDAAEKLEKQREDEAGKRPGPKL